MNTIEPYGETIPTKCPICGGREFSTFNTRQNAICNSCGSFERTRLSWLVFERLDAGKNPLNILHFAPEKCIAYRLALRCGSAYRAFDFYPSGYKLKIVDVQQLNLCNGLRDIALQNVDVILHNHVLEHLPCNYQLVLKRLNNLLKPGGVHIFSVPIVSDYYSEDLDESLSPAVRKTRFGQEDHVRAFGRYDTRKAFADIFNQDVHFSSTVSLNAEEVCRAAVPESVLRDVNSHTVFVYIKN